MNLLKGLKDNFSKEELIEILTDLVKAPSENPPGDERQISKVCKKHLDKLGFDTEIFTSDKKRVNLIATKTWGKKGRTLIWSGHMDVVPAGDPNLWNYPPYEVSMIKDRMYGRGTADMKGGIASALEAVAAITRMGKKLKGKIVFLLSADEECSSRLGMDYLTKKGIVNKDTGDAAIVGEPTELDILITEKGYVWLTISTIGKAAHSSQPAMGLNAIEKMSKVICKIKSIESKEKHPILGKPTKNIAIIEGGTKINIIPDRCSIKIDRRTLPNENKEMVLKEFEKVIDELKREDKDLKAELKMFDYADSSEISPEEEIVKIAEKAVLAITKRKPKLSGLVAATDARFLINQCGIPTIICGPGSLKQAHVANEYTTMEQVVDASMLYAFIIAEFLGV
ncbi:M20 family metallopeptidase [candidate division WOR-3 bacterium]|nr:M20 family metallopeptidase [candidate division WOR-3 bacterium]